jgi:hypothetical protein
LVSLVVVVLKVSLVVVVLKVVLVSSLNIKTLIAHKSLPSCLATVLPILVN